MKNQKAINKERDAVTKACNKHMASLDICELIMVLRFIFALKDFRT